LFFPAAQQAVPVSNELTKQVGFEETENLDLAICLRYELRSFYQYQPNSQAAQETLQTIYNRPIHILGSGQMELSAINYLLFFLTQHILFWD